MRILYRDCFLIACTLCGALWIAVESASDDRRPPQDNRAASESPRPKRGAQKPPRTAESQAKQNAAVQDQDDADDPNDRETADEETPSAREYSEGEAALLKMAGEFINAFANHDAAKAAEQFAEDAEYVDVMGNVLSGRETIQTVISELFKDDPDCRLELAITGIRFVGPALAIEDGTSIRISGKPNGAPHVAQYTAIHTRSENGWLLASVREHSCDTGHQHVQRLRQLHWLIGNWVDEQDDSVVSFACRPTDGGRFLIRDFEVSLAGEKILGGTQRIGWDPIAGKLRAWTFDSDGGFFEGFWHRDGDAWVLSSNGVTSSGKTASGRWIFRQLNDHTLSWQSVDREVDGSRLDDSREYTLVRRGPAPEKD
jgi:uncharacterized protein (TIGR02246 family)